jgi:hypothetical protein
MYKVKHEPVRPQDHTLMEAFRAAKGYKDTDLLPMGWFAEFARAQSGMSHDESYDMVMRIYFDRQPHEAALYDMLAGASEEPKISECLAHLQNKFGIDSRAAAQAVQNALAGLQAFATCGKELQRIRLLKKNEDVGYWP